MIDTIQRDVKYAWRSLRKAPAFSLAAVLTLALGIGANAAMFSIADATAFRPPDVPNPDEIARVFSSTPEMPYGEVSYADYQDFRRAATRTVSGLVAYETADFALARDPKQPAAYRGGWAVSGNFFSALGVEPSLGRGFGAEDDRTDAAVAVISDRLWKADFEGRTDVVGTRVTLSGSEFTIVGVAPDRFTGTELYFHPDVFIPLSSLRRVLPALPADVLEDRSRQWVTVLARLRNGITADQATIEFAAVARNLESQYPTNRQRTALVLPEVTARARLDAGGAQGALIIMALVSLILLLACANVANLMLSRGAARTRELAIRAAVGATRRRLVGQLLTESLVLALCGGAVGVLVTQWTLAYLSTVIVVSSALPISVDLRLDGRVLLFAAVTTLATGILAGITPALQTARAGLSAWLKQSVGVPRRTRLTVRTSLLVVQVAICVLVLASAGLLIRAFLTAQRVDPGFRTDRVLLASFNPGLVRYTSAQASRFYNQVVERARVLPGVASVGLTRYVPLGVTGGSVTLTVDGARMPAGRDTVTVAETTVDEGYWSVLRIAIVRGRAFDAGDTASSPRVAIVNETFATQYWPGQDPIGRTVRTPDVPTPNGPQTLALEVVGVARDGKYEELGEAPRPFIYRPFAQVPRIAMTVAVLARGEPAALASAVRAIAADVDPSVPIFDVQTLDHLYRSQALLPSRIMSQLVTMIALLGLVLASVGLYGVIAFLSARRTREIGLRMAVGASPGRVRRMVLWQATTLLVPGLIGGIGLSVLLTPLLGSPAFDFVSPRDPLVLTVAPLLTAAMALLAAALPAFKASRVDPTVALRSE